MENTGKIYGILNLDSLKIYIGQSKDIKRRKRDHIKKLKDNKHINDHLQHAWNKYGEKKFTFIILEEDIPNDNLTARELYWINQKGSLNRDKGYNLCIPDIDTHHKHSEESKEKNRRDIYTRYYGEPESEEAYEKWKYTRRKQREDRGDVNKQSRVDREILYFDKETGKLLGEFKSTGEAGEKLKLASTRKKAGKRVQAVMSPKTKSKSYKGYTFIYKKDYNPDKDYSFPTGKRGPNKIK